MIPIQEARGVFTRALVDRWNELGELAPKMFLGSFCTKKTSVTKEVSIEVMRGTEKVAVDVLRGTAGNRNQFSRSAEKLFVPPFYSEYFDATELDRYDLLFGQSAVEVGGNIITGMIEQALDKLNILKYKIQRAYELQCSQVLENGIVQLVSGDNIDYKRKAASMVANEENEYWTVETVNPLTQLENAAVFLRTIGKATDGEFNVVCGQNAVRALIASKFVDNNNYKTLALVDLKMPQANAEGGVYHGTLSAGPYKFHIWSYPEYYDNTLGVSTPYIKADYIYVLPVRSLRSVMSFAGIPAIIRDPRQAEFPEFIKQMESDYYVNNFIDPVGKKHVFEISSAGLCIPVSVDRIYSAKVTGTVNPQN